MLNEKYFKKTLCQWMHFLNLFPGLKNLKKKYPLAGCFKRSQLSKNLQKLFKGEKELSILESLLLEREYFIIKI